jgi:polysaccharide pyruvyl transferase WcaK-like protein
MAAAARLRKKLGLLRAEATRGRTDQVQVGIAGAYGKGNYGDELFIDVFRHWLSPECRISVLPDLPDRPYFSEPVARRVAKLDAIIVGGGDLIRPHMGIDERWLNNAFSARPIYLAGVGVQLTGREDRTETIAAWRRYLGHVRFTGMRDPVSAAWVAERLDPATGVVTHPDLVWSLPLPPAVRPEGAPILGLVTRYNRQWTKQYQGMEEIGRTLIGQGWRVRHIIAGNGTVGEQDFEDGKRLEIPGKEVVHTQDLSEISQALGECSRIISMKFHATLVAAKYGVPVLSANPVAKTRALLDSFGRSDLAHPETSADLVRLGIAGFEPIAADAISQRVADCEEFMRELKQRLLSDLTSADTARGRKLARVLG